MIRNLYNQIPQLTPKTKGKEAHSQIDKLSRETSTESQTSTSIPNKWSFSYPS